MQKKYIFQLGMICAGSTSLCEALNILGIPSLHWKGPDKKIFENNVIPENIKFGRRLFYPYDEEFTGFLDFNGRLYYKMLYEMYPESKFIYTWRAYEPWYESALRLKQNQWKIKGATWIGAGGSEMRKLRNLNSGINMPNKELELVKTHLEYYWKDNQEIPEFFRNNPRFLEMKICDGNNDGWEKLCGFLGKDIPKVDFPNMPSNNFIFPTSNK